MIGYVSRQALHARNGNDGQATVLFLVVSLTLATVVFMSIALHNVTVAQVACATAVDAIALTAATWEARCLNLIAALNDGVASCLLVIRWVCVAWAALAIAAAYGAGIPPFINYTRYARKLIRAYWKTAHQLVEWSERIRKAAPYLVLGETIALAKKRHVTGILFPFDPRGPHDAKNTLELHVAPGSPIYLTDAILPISSALDRLKSIPLLKSAGKVVISVLSMVIEAILGGAEGPLRMLVLEDDFPSRQFVRFSGSLAVPRIDIPLLDRKKTDRLSAESQAEPYGGGSDEMSWKSRLTPWKSK